MGVAGCTYLPCWGCWFRPQCRYLLYLTVVELAGPAGTAGTAIEAVEATTLCQLALVILWLAAKLDLLVYPVVSITSKEVTKHLCARFVEHPAQ